jgi:hypothetical protein
MLGNGCSYVPNFGHSDEMPLLLTPSDKFVTLNILGRIGLRNVLIWLHRMDSFSLLMDLFAGAELSPAYSLTF